MASPLVMLGPGGDYQVRYDVKGRALVRTSVGPSQQTGSDTESAGSYAGYSKMPRRRSGLAQQPATVTNQEITAATVARFSDVFEHANRPTALGLYGPRPMALRSPQAIPLASASQASPAPARQIRGPVPARAIVLVPQLAAALAQSPTLPSSESSHESRQPDPQATAHSDPHSRPAPGAWLLAHHAGTGRRTGRQQSHHLRARRSPHQERRDRAAAQQGTLFGD